MQGPAPEPYTDKRIYINLPAKRTELYTLFYLKFVDLQTKGNRIKPSESKASVIIDLFHLLTYLLHAARSSLINLAGSAASQEIPRIFGTRRFLTVFTSARHLSLS